jgi:hypothetical protein
MTVKELIDILIICDPDAMVVAKGYEGGYSDIGSIYNIQLELNVNKEIWDYGDHEQKDNGVDAVLIN